MGNRTAILLSCCREDADMVRERARLDNRTVSGYVLNIVLRSVAFEATLRGRLGRAEFDPIRRAEICPPGPKSPMLLRCSSEQAEAIRAAAKYKRMSVSGFVRSSLRKSWSASEQIWTRNVA